MRWSIQSKNLRSRLWIVICAGASICAAHADEAALREKLKSFLAHPGITGLLYGPFGDDGKQLAANDEAEKLSPNGAPIAVELLENATALQEKVAAMCLVSFYLRKHPVGPSVKARARKAVVAELATRPMKRDAVSNIAIKFLGMFGEYSDLPAIEPYIISGDVHEGLAHDVRQSILKRAGRTSPRPPAGVP